VTRAIFDAWLYQHPPQPVLLLTDETIKRQCERIWQSRHMMASNAYVGWQIYQGRVVAYSFKRAVMKRRPNKDLKYTHGPLSWRKGTKARRDRWH
jgi:hypothetical protein